MQYLVTGGAGFIGSHLVEALLRAGHEVTVLDNFSTGKRENLDPFRADIYLIEGDIRDPAVVRSAVRHVDVVIHEAALPSVPRSIADPITTNEVNVGGTLNLLDAALRAGVRRFVYASSSSVYGDSPELPKRESMRPMPRSPYAVSKLAGEQYCQVFTALHGMQTVALRYFNIFGPRQDPGSAYAAVIPKFITAMLRGESPVIFGTGEQSRDFTFVENVVQANLLAATANCASGLAMNVACNARTTLNQLVQILNEILGTEIVARHESSRTGDVSHSLADVELACAQIGYRPVVEFGQGLRRTVEYYQERVAVGNGVAYAKALQTVAR